MRFFDFSSWHGVMTTVLGFGLFMVLGMGVRVLMMMTVQQRQQRMNRQINERLRTLMAAYKVLGGSFTGRLQIDPRSRRKYREGQEMVSDGERADLSDDPGTLVPEDAMTSEQVTILASEQGATLQNGGQGGGQGGLSAVVIERRIQMRDAVEAALSDVLLLGTEEHVRLASVAAAQLAAGNPIQTAELVVSLRAYIRKALGLEIIPADVLIPAQGPTRPSAASAGRGGRGEGERGREGAGGMGGGGGGMGMGMGLGAGMGRRSSADDT